MIITETYYICYCCKQKVKGKSDLKRVVLPYRPLDSDGMEINFYNTYEFDVCQECLSIIFESLKNYGKIKAMDTVSTSPAIKQI